MSNKYTNELYEKIKGSFAESKKSAGGIYRNILKTKADNTYLVRIIPNVDDPDKTFFRYYLHGWSSTTDGRYVSATCPTTFEEECPICQERFRLWNKGDDESKLLSKSLARKERFYANVYVVDDPDNPENNGSVKVLGYGRQIAKVIEEAMEGDDAEEVGARMFDFSKEGCNLRIKVTKNQAGFPNYDLSKFVSPSSIDVTLDTVLEDLQDFDPLLNMKTSTELKGMVDEALYGMEPTAEAVAPAPSKTSKPAEKVKVDEIPMDFVTESGDDVLAGLENL